MEKEIKSENEGFNEPVLRCDSCKKMVVKDTINEIGMCNYCGNKRFRPVDVFNDDELVQIKKLDNSENFLMLFKEADIEDNLFTSKPLFGEYHKEGVYEK